MNLAQVLIDNPILVKHCRSPSSWADLALGGDHHGLGREHHLGGEYYPWIGNASAAMVVLGLQVLILWFGGSNQLNVSLGGSAKPA